MSCIAYWLVRLLSDVKGSVVATTSSAQLQTGDMRYDAFGNKTYYVNTAGTFGWNAKSQYQTEPGGLMLLGNRYYDCTTGRFISQDPAQDESNWYSYCGNNPLVAVDPTGLTEKPGSAKKIAEEIKKLADLARRRRDDLAQDANNEINKDPKGRANHEKSWRQAKDKLSEEIGKFDKKSEAEQGKNPIPPDARELADEKDAPRPAETRSGWRSVREWSGWGYVAAGGVVVAGGVAMYLQPELIPVIAPATQRLATGLAH